MRSRSESAENPANTTLCTAPIRAHASIVAGRSGTIGRYRHTRSPFFTPRLFSTFAHRHTSSSSSAYEYGFDDPGSSPSQISATRSPRPCATCRSRQFSDAFSLPPSNQRTRPSAKSQSRTRSHFARQSRRSAAPAQKPSGSLTDASYSSRYASNDGTSALFENDSGGG